MKPNFSEQDIERLLAGYSLRARRGARWSVVVAVLISMLAGAFLFYVIDTMQGSASSEQIYKILDTDREFLSDLIIKKGAETSSTNTSQDSQYANQLAISIRNISNSDLISLLGSSTLAEEVFQRLLNENPEDWITYASAQQNSARFALSMSTLRMLGLANFVGSNVREATITSRGNDVARILERQETQQQATSNFRTLNPLNLIGGELPRRERPDAILNFPDLVLDGGALEDVFEQFSDNWYRLTIPSNDAYALRTFAPASGYGVDTELTLYDSTGVELLGYDDDGAEAEGYSLLLENLDSGTFLLRVSSYFSEPGGYRLELVKNLGEYFPTITLPPTTNPTLLTAGQELESELVNGQSSLWFEMVVTTPSLYEIETLALAAESEFDTIIELFQPESPESPESLESLELMGTDDDSGSGTYSFLREELSAGTYYIRVTSFWGESGNFQIIFRDARVL